MSFCRIFLLCVGACWHAFDESTANKDLSVSLLVFPSCLQFDKIAKRLGVVSFQSMTYDPKPKTSTFTVPHSCLRLHLENCSSKLRPLEYVFDDRTLGTVALLFIYIYLFISNTPAPFLSLVLGLLCVSYILLPLCCSVQHIIYLDLCHLIIVLDPFALTALLRGCLFLKTIMP